MNIAIIDDCMADRLHLIKCLKLEAKKAMISIRFEEYGSGEKFLNQSLLPTLDAVFLDIYMNEIDGIEVAKQLRLVNSSCQIIFVSASSKFAVQSYEVRAFYYILKPFTALEIAHVLTLLDHNLKKSSHYIKVKTGKAWIKVFLSDLIYVDYSNHYIFLHTENQVINTHLNFQDIEKVLLVYLEFICCYRCIIVNMNAISKVDGFFFLLTNGEYIPINRKRANEIKTHYYDYLLGRIEKI